MDGVERSLEQAVRHLKAQELRSSHNRPSPRYSIVLRVELRVIEFVPNLNYTAIFMHGRVPFPRAGHIRLNLVTNSLLIS